MKIRKLFGLPLAALAVGIGMALAAPPALIGHEVDVGTAAISEVQALGAETAPSDALALEGVASYSIVCATIAHQEKAITDHAATMTTSAATITATDFAKLDVDTATALADAGVKAIPVVAHATQVAIFAEQEVDIAEKAEGDALALKIV